MKVASRWHIEMKRFSVSAFQSIPVKLLKVTPFSGTNCDDELTPFEIEELLTKRRIQIECINPACEDRSLFSTRRHRFQVSLHDLIEVYIRGGP